MDEATLEERLASLDFISNTKAQSVGEQELPPMLKPPSADSVYILLKQALHAEDHALLLDSLYTRDEKVIANSALLLSPVEVLKLLKSLVSMVQSRGAVLVCALPWLRSLVSQHASSILSQESSLLVLNSLYQLIESRISTVGLALELSTCLDYQYAAIPDEEADEVSTPPPVVYEDKDSADESEEDAMDVMDTDEETEDLGVVIHSPDGSDGSEVMSD